MNIAAPVSVVVPCYRCSRTIVRAVESVAAQTLRPAEVILVEDASQDGTIDLLVSLAAAYDPGWIKLKLLDRNVGAARARNVGWDMASQPFVAFLDSDDAWHPEKIEIQYGFMRVSPDVALTGHGHRLSRDQGEMTWAPLREGAHAVKKWPLLLSNRFITPSVMVQNKPQYRFIESQRHMEDHMLWMQIFFDGGKLVKLSNELAVIFKHPFGEAGLSAQLWLMERAELGNYHRLKTAGLIADYEYKLLCAYSLLKFARRMLLKKWRLLWTR
jgi:glycosyltransferase involved in cell wall biosynthesis